MTPFTYEELSWELEKIPDLITSMGTSIYEDNVWAIGTWRRYIRDRTTVQADDPTTANAALCWALYLHTATDDAVTAEVRTWNAAKWLGWSTKAVLADMARGDLPTQTLRLRRLFLTPPGVLDVAVNMRAQLKLVPLSPQELKQGVWAV